MEVEKARKVPLNENGTNQHGAEGCSARTPSKATRGENNTYILRRIARDKRIFNMWMSCHTQQEIGDAVGLERSTVTKTTDDFVNLGQLSDIHKAAANNTTDFEKPIYNIWKQQKKTAGSSESSNLQSFYEGHWQGNRRNR
jgi:hypothetical protein